MTHGDIDLEHVWPPYGRGVDMRTYPEQTDERIAALEMRVRSLEAALAAVPMSAIRARNIGDDTLADVIAIEDWLASLPETAVQP